MKLFTVPNLFTLGNLFCGCLGIVFAFQGDLVWTAYLVGIAAVLDFLDGFVARLLKSHSPIGKELDSLADMVTFGVLPGIIMFHLLGFVITQLHPFDTVPQDNQYGSLWLQYNMSSKYSWLQYIAFLIPLFSALRLAKFNVDTRQSDSFIGVPTPANTILIASIPLILWSYTGMFHGVMTPALSFWDTGDAAMNSLVDVFVSLRAHALLLFLGLAGITVIMSFLLISELPLFALKFKSFGWKGNEIRYIFLGLSVLLFVLLRFTGIPLVIVLYVLLSVVNNLLKKKPSPAA